MHTPNQIEYFLQNVSTGDNITSVLRKIQIEYKTDSATFFKIFQNHVLDVLVYKTSELGHIEELERIYNALVSEMAKSNISNTILFAVDESNPPNKYIKSVLWKKYADFLRQRHGLIPNVAVEKAAEFFGMKVYGGMHNNYRKYLANDQMVCTRITNLMRKKSHTQQDTAEVIPTIDEGHIGGNWLYTLHSQVMDVLSNLREEVKEKESTVRNLEEEYKKCLDQLTEVVVAIMNAKYISEPGPTSIISKNIESFQMDIRSGLVTKIHHRS